MTIKHWLVGLASQYQDGLLRGNVCSKDNYFGPKPMSCDLFRYMSALVIAKQSSHPSAAWCYRLAAVLTAVQHQNSPLITSSQSYMAVQMLPGIFKRFVGLVIERKVRNPGVEIGMSDKLPAMQFYPGDWKKDAGVQALDLETKGAWFEMLLLMHESEERGKLLLNGLPMPTEALARVLGVTIDKCQQLVSKLLSYGVASIEKDSGALSNRRMLRDEVLRKSRAMAGELGGKQKAINASSRRLANPTPSSSSSTSSSTSSSVKLLEEANASSLVSAAENNGGKKLHLSILGIYEPTWNQEPWPSLRRFVAIYNEQSPKQWPAIKNLDSSRGKKIRAATREFPKQEQWEGVFRQAKQSVFLTTKCNAVLRKGLDWLLWRGKDGTFNFVKVAEGVYGE